MTRRFKLTLEYDGTPFHGFQRQENVPTIQNRLEEAIKLVASQPPQTFQVAGRTDRGVHALGMVCSFDLSHDTLQPFNLKDGINCLVRPHIAVTKVEEVPLTFQARFDATARAYEYRLINRRAHSPLWRSRAAHVKYPLDIELMRKEAACLLGRHDFSSFRSTACQAKSPITALTRCDIEQNGEQIVFYVEGAAFLHNMVRIIVGTLVDIGRGRLPADSMQKILAAKDRTQAGQTLGSEGLYFKRVTYPEHDVFDAC